MWWLIQHEALKTSSESSNSASCSVSHDNPTVQTSPHSFTHSWIHPHSHLGGWSPPPPSPASSFLKERASCSMWNSGIKALWLKSDKTNKQTTHPCLILPSLGKIEMQPKVVKRSFAGLWVHPPSPQFTNYCFQSLLLSECFVTLLDGLD